jgi:hypothetical protein
LTASDNGASAGHGFVHAKTLNDGCHAVPLNLLTRVG